jgi:hypothetical protein
MKPIRWALFVVAAFLSVSAYYGARAVWHVTVPTLIDSHLLHYVFDLVVPVVLALILARGMGLLRGDTGLAGKAAIILVAALVWFPAKLFDTYVALEACGAFGGCFN